MIRRFSAILLAMTALCWPCHEARAAFGLTSSSSAYTVDTGAGLVFKVRRTDNGSSTQSAGDLMSLVFNGVEYQNQSRGSHINSGFDYLYNGISDVSVAATTVGADTVKVTVIAGDLTHYYMARRNEPRIFMATYFTREPETQALCRFIVRMPAALVPNGPEPSDIRGNTGAIESGDIFGMPDGTTRSKHYSNMRLIDWSTIGATGSNVGVWMQRGNHEGDSGGPFYRSLLNQCGDDQEITYIINYGEAQTEPYRLGILNGPYVLSFTTGAPPTVADTSWVGGLGLTGYVGPAGRGAVTASGISGRDTSQRYTAAFANATAQYWADVSPVDGSFTSTGMLPGTYTMRIFKEELEVHSAEVTVSAGGVAALGALAITSDPATVRPLWRIGRWDGSPRELRNGDKVTTMHPSDVRMADWSPGTYVIGTSTPAGGMPAYQWKDVNGSQAIQFELAPHQLTASTVRIGLTTAFSGARPKISLNSWNFPTNPPPSSQPSTRTLTVGTYRGNNVTYTFAVPASALVAGTNTLWIFPISGSGGTGFLSPGYSLDCIDFFQGTAITQPLPAAPGNAGVSLSGNQATVSWSAAPGATSYTVRRATQPGGPYQILAADLAGTTYTDSGLPGGATYFYVVSGSNSSGSGPFSAEVSVTPPLAGPIAHLKFDETAGTVAQDASGNGWTGALVNGAVRLAPSASRIGGAVALDGVNDHVTLPAGIAAGLNDFTLSAWVKWNGGGDWQRVIDFGSGTNNYLFLTPKAFGGGVRFAIRTAAVGEQQINGPAALPVGVWTHVAVTLSGNSGTLYVNGSAVGTNAAMTLRPASLGATPANFLGRSQFAPDPYLNGAIDDFRLYGRALGAGELAALAAPYSAIESWRQANFGTPENAGPAADTADPDGDGTDNFTEFRLGLRPDDATSAFRASGIGGPDGYRLAWPAAAGLTFDVLRATDPAGPWETIGTTTGSGVFLDASPPPGAAFYRVALRP